MQFNDMRGGDIVSKATTAGVTVAKAVNTTKVLVETGKKTALSGWRAVLRSVEEFKAGFKAEVK